MPYRPHDLLWLTDAAALVDAAPRPDWVDQAWWPALPVVVRRATAPAGQVAIGIRGARRSQRHAGWACCADVLDSRTPEALLDTPLCHARRQHIPALQALWTLKQTLSGCAWGPTGSTAFELASGQAMLRHDSDLDLLIRCPVAPERASMEHWLSLFAGQPCRIDAQLDTPAGGVALLEWAGLPPQVLLKTATGPRLVNNPWQAG